MSKKEKQKEKQEEIRQIGFNAVMTWQKVDKPNGVRLIAHEFNGVPEIKLVKVKDGIEAFALIHLDKRDNPISQQQEVFEETMQNAARLLEVEPEQTLKALKEKGEEGIQYIDIPVRNMPLPSSGV